MKTLNQCRWLLGIFVVIMTIAASQCKKDENEAMTPSLNTTSVGKITDNSAIVTGYIASDGGDAILARGICWGTGVSPTISNNKTIEGADTGSFSSGISGLAANTLYYVRAYATNSAGTSYGAGISFTTPPLVTDIDGNVYHTVIIGNHTWMTENLKVTHYRNGDPIAEITDPAEWSSCYTAACCMYNNSELYLSPYGRLYNWYAMHDSRHLAPAGWHVPTDSEWNTLEGSVDSKYPVGDPEWDKITARGVDAGGNLKSTAPNWDSPNLGATNSSGFTAMPGGYRGINGICYSVGGMAALGCSSEFDAQQCWVHLLWNGDARAERSYCNKTIGFSVRCIKDYN